jgi:hypothetical protein
LFRFGKLFRNGFGKLLGIGFRKLLCEGTREGRLLGAGVLRGDSLD